MNAERKLVPKKGSYVFDSSVVIALLSDEPARQIAEELLPGARISAVNLAEVASTLSHRGLDAREVSENLAALGLDVIDFDDALAYRVGQLRVPTRTLGLSLGDRACLATALELDLPVVTADRVWSKLDLGLDIRVIR